VGAPLAEAGAALRFDGALERRLHELAVIAVAAHWRAEFQWVAHAHYARRAGLAEAIIDAIRAGVEPPDMDREERAVYAVVTQLLRNGSVSADAFEAAREALGEEALVELVALCGYSTTVAFTLNAFEVPPPDVAP
jgi:4-carboxymuconolactone decarboxylase